ncbi:MAG: hypothetical protein J0M02_18490 [Planctomycetes bacterium]|nr:hypothetical protein [Planctomycetota bacterium]
MRFVIACPGASRTGGPEALHQLAHALSAGLGREARMLYQQPLSEAVIAHYQALYPCPREDGPDAVRDAVLVLPESEDPRRWSAHAPRCVWSWFLSETMWHPVAAYGSCGILCQSEAVRAMFAAPGGGLPDDVRMLGDYVRAVLPPGVRRRACIAVNGARNAALASALERNHGLRVRLIAGLAPEEALRAVAGCDIYLDAGWHPGKDRGPREAALLGCIVLTGRHGTASGPDVPLPDEHKLGDIHPSRIADLVRAIRREPGRHLAMQAGYRAWIAGERDRFHAEVAALADAPLVGAGLQVDGRHAVLIDAIRGSANSRLDQLVQLNAAAQGDFLPGRMTLAARLIAPWSRLASRLVNGAIALVRRVRP